METTTLKFRKAGTAYLAKVHDGTWLWIRRNDGHGVDLVWQRKDPNGKNEWHTLGKHKTIAAAIEDANWLAKDW